MSRQGRHVTPAVVLAVVVLVCARSVATETTRPNGCELTDVEVHWIQRALDGWDLVRRDFLKVDDAIGDHQCNAADQLEAVANERRVAGRPESRTTLNVSKRLRPFDPVP